MITSTTTICGIFGHPIKHSLSPKMHNSAFAFLGLDYCYLPFDVTVDCLADAVKAIKALNIRGVNVTVPHKESVMKYLDFIDDEASEIGAVNTIVNDNNNLKGYNTDARGFYKSIEDAGISLSKKTVLILGAGGAAKAVAYSLCNVAGKIIIYNRTVSKAESLCRHVQSFKSVSSKVNFIEQLTDIDMNEVQCIINTTSLGLSKNDTMPIDKRLLMPKHIVYDLIYHPTELLQSAQNIGCMTFNGLAMLLWQGVLAFQLWTNTPAPVEIMKRQLM